MTTTRDKSSSSSSSPDPALRTPHSAEEPTRTRKAEMRPPVDEFADYTKQIKDLVAERDALKEERDSLRLERDALAGLLEQACQKRIQLQAALRQTKAVPMPAPRDYWKCYHCGEVFITEDAAREHFGNRDPSNPLHARNESDPNRFSTLLSDLRGLIDPVKLGCVDARRALERLPVWMNAMRQPLSLLIDVIEDHANKLLARLDQEQP